MTTPGYTESKAREMAKSVLTNTLRVRAGESVAIETFDSSIDWANAFVLEARRLGASPLLIYNDEATYWKSLDVAGAKSLGQVGAHEWALLERTNAYVNFWGPPDGVRNHRLADDVREKINAYEDRWFQIADRAGVRMARMWLGQISPSTARAFGTDVDGWTRELVDATLVDPFSMHKMGQKVAERLRKGTSIEIRHPNGTELRLRLRHRQPRVESGILSSPPRGAKRLKGHSGFADVNIPAGNVIVAVDEGSADGRLLATETSDSLNGPREGGAWEFHDGKLTSYSYKTGQESFQREFAEAGLHLGTPGAISIGLNPKIHRAPLMRDQRLGAISVTIGGNRFWGGETDGHGFYPFLTIHDGELRIDGKSVVQPAD